jgi:hypothetical protein
MLRLRSRLPRVAAVYTLFLAFLPPAAVAQSATQGALAGIAVDADGAIIPDATLRLESFDSRTTLTLNAGPDGRFLAPALDPGRWRLYAESTGTAGQGAVPAHGVATLLNPGIFVDIEVGRTTMQSIVLAAHLHESVTVVAQSMDDASGPESHDETDAAVAVSITPLEIKSLPSNGRRWNNFALLAPTAAPDGATGDISFRAIAALFNQTTLDGASDTPQFNAQDNSRSRAPFTVSQSAVREYQINVATYSAEYGRAAGAVINTVTERGGQRVHGNIFFFDREATWLSNNPGVPLVLPQPDGTLIPQSLPGDNRQQWGLAIGGPVPALRHRLYWHTTYDQQQRDFPALSTITNSPQLALSQAVPSDSTGNNPSGYSCASLTTGPLKSTGSETTASVYGAQGACFLNLYDSTLYPTYAFAAAAYDNALAYVYSLLGQAPRHATTVSNLPRLDWDVSSRSNLTLAWNRVRFTSPAGGQTQPFVADGVTSLGNDRLAIDDTSARLNTLLSPLLDNELRLGYAHDSESEYAQSPFPQEPHTAPNGTNAPGVRISETLTLGTPPNLSRTAYPRESRLQIADTLAWVHRNHTFRVGADFLHTTDGIAALYAGAGDYHYDNIQEFLIDEATQQAIPSERCGINNSSQYLCYSSYEQGLGAPGISFHINNYAFYMQDDWKFSRRLTINLGLRYDYEQLPTPQLPNTLLPGSASFPADKNNFAPRIGFAWDIFGGGSTLLRGGYGMFYGLTPGTSIFNALLNTGVISTQSLGQSRYLFTSGADSPSYPETLSAVPATTAVAPTVTVFAPHFQQPSIQQASLTAEHSIHANTVIQATGLLSLARDLPIVTDTNLYSPGSNNLPSSVTYSFSGGPFDGKSETFPFFAGPRPNLNFGPIHTIESRVNATYSAFIVSVRHRANAQLDLRTHYTWSHAIDDGEQTSASATRNELLDPFDLPLERSNSTLDRPQRLVVAAVWHPLPHFDHDWLQIAARQWELSPILQIASGAPYSAVMLGTAPAQENSIGSQTIRPTSYGYLGAGGANFLSLFGRNHFRQPTTQLVDLRLARRISFSERLHLLAAVEAFNLLNHRNISSASTDAPINTVAYRVGSGQSGFGSTTTPALATWQPTFGTPLTANATNLFTTRQLQASVRLEF